MKKTTLTDELIAAGHLTREESSFGEPVTLSGDYRGANGFTYSVGWNSGQITVSELGRSAEYCVADRAFGRPVLGDEEYAEWEAHMRRALNLPRVPDNAYGLEHGDKIQIGEHKFTYHHSYGTTETGFVVGNTGYGLPYGDGISLYQIDKKGRVDCGGALVGEIRNGEFFEYETPII